MLAARVGDGVSSPRTSISSSSESTAASLLARDSRPPLSEKSTGRSVNNFVAASLIIISGGSRSFSFILISNLLGNILTGTFLLISVLPYFCTHPISAYLFFNYYLGTFKLFDF